MPKHFMRIRDLGHSGAWEIIRRAKEMKETNYRGHCMDGKVAALIFEKASTRTRVSFDVAVRQLGGTTIFMTPAESQLGRSEPLRDTARVLSRYVDCLIVRTFGQEKLDELAEYGSLPVVNALTDQGHPCQLMADLLTIYERTPDFSKVTVTWVGDGNNMANSWIEAAMYFPFQLNMAIAPGYEPDQQLLALALQSGAKIFLTHDPKLAVDGANYIYADVWASMGQEEEQKKREEAFKGFCVDSELMSLAAPGVKFLHCLPAHRGEEVTDEVMDHPERSLCWVEAENRKHSIRAILAYLCPKTKEDADAADAARRLAGEGLRPDVVCVDPPRKGLAAGVVETIAGMAPDRVIYVSCDPATLGRDVKRLREGGYLLQQAEAVDLFPRTGHVETVCLLSKLNTERHVEVELNLKGLD